MECKIFKLRFIAVDVCIAIKFLVNESSPDTTIKEVKFLVIILNLPI